MEIEIERFVTGPIETNTYVVHAQKANSCLVFDPSSGCAEVVRFIQNLGVPVEAVCLTHGHFDHIMGIEEITSPYPNASVWIHGEDKQLLRDPEYNGSVMLGIEFCYDKGVNELKPGGMTMGDYSFEVLHVPGHSPGGCVFVLGNNCISGDTVFAGSIGRTDFPGCDGELFIREIRAKLLSLSDNTVLFPGHGGRTTIGREKRRNPFLA